MAKFKKAKEGIKFKAWTIEMAIIGILFVLFASYVNADCGCIGINTNTIYKCGDYVNESCTLNCNLTCSGNGLILNADNIILDGNGYSLTGPEINYLGNEYTVGIITKNKENITIRNFEISNFSNGIIPIPLSMGGSMKNYSIMNNRVHHMSSCGISLYGASGSKIVNNTCYLIKLDGIDSAPGNNNVIENNTCYNNKGGIGFYGSTTQNNTIKNNNLYNNKWGIIFGWAGPNHNKILNNTIYNNTYFGIYLYYGSSFNEIYNNTIKNNKNGIFLTKCHPVNTNVCYTGNVTNNTIAYNEISGNSAYGIYINSSTNNTIISNKICENNVSDVAVFNGTINATGNLGDNNSCSLGLNYKDISASSDNFCTHICNCSSNSECLSNKCVNGICKSPTKNITVGLVIKYPNNETIKKCVKVKEYANGKEILDAAGIEINGSDSANWGFFLNCINNTCSPSDYSWYWEFEMHKINETNWSSMPVGTGPGGINNNFCWNGNYNSNQGHYCARDGDVILFNATKGRSVLPYSWCMEGDFDNDNLIDIFDAVSGLEYLSGKNYSDHSEKCIRKEDINLFEILNLIGKIGLS